MKKALKSTAAIIAFLMAISGCNDSGKITDENVTSQGETENVTDNVERTPITEVKETFEQEINNLKSTAFENITFENLKDYSFPNVEKITTYRIIKEIDPDYLNCGLTPEDFFDKFATLCDYLSPGEITREEIAENVLIQGSFERDPAGDINYNQFNELYKDKGESIEYMELHWDSFYLAYFGERYVYWYASDSIKKLEGKGDEDYKTISYSLEDESYTAVAYTENMESTDVYHLMDGDISIADAAEKANEHLVDLASQVGGNRGTPVHVCAVSVIDIGNGNYAYYFYTTPCIDGIKIAFTDCRNGGKSYDSRNDDSLIGASEFQMLTSDKIDYVLLTHDGFDEGEIAPEDTYNEMLPLKTAAEKASSLLSKQMKLKAKSVTLIYDTSNDDPKEIVPFWRFVLEGDNKAKYYHVYVNAIDGTARVNAVQDVEFGQDLN